VRAGMDVDSAGIASKGEGACRRRHGGANLSLPRDPVCALVRNLPDTKYRATSKAIWRHPRGIVKRKDPGRSWGTGRGRSRS